MSKLLIIILGLWVAAKLAGVVLRRVLANFTAIPRPAPAPSSGGTAERRLVRDPCCGVYVSASPELALREAGELVYFCSATCRDRHRARRVS